MSIVDWINGLFLRRLRRSRVPSAVVGDSLLLGDETFALDELTGAIAYEADIYVGSIIALALSFGDGRTLTVTREDVCWNDLLAALDRLKLTNAPSREWSTAMIAGEGRERPIVLRGDRRIAQ